MVKTIILRVGGAVNAWAISEFIENNKMLLLAHGCATISSQWACKTQTSPENAKNANLFNIVKFRLDDNATLETFFTTLQNMQANNQAYAEISTLIINAPQAVNACEMLQVSVAWLKRSFPEARLHLLLSMLPQHVEFAPAYTCNALAGTNITLAQTIAELSNYEDALKRLLAALPQEDIICLVSESAAEDYVKTLEVLRGMANIPAEVVFDTSSELPQVLPMIFLWLCVLSGRVFWDEAKDICHTWRLNAAVTLLRQSTRACTPGGALESPSAYLATAQLHAQLMEKFAESNQAAACLLQRDHIFSASFTDTAKLPFRPVLSEALAILKYFDLTFLHSLYARLAARPFFCDDYHLRFLHEALRQYLPQISSRHPHTSLFENNKVAVLTQTFNHEKYIERNIRSVLEQQTDFKFIHIIVDDASTDKTQDIIKQYALQYNHIVPIFMATRSGKNGRQIEMLFDMAKTPYVALCEGDDYFTDPGKLQLQADYLDAHPDCGLCFHPVRVLYEDDAEKERIFPPAESLPGGVRPFYTLADLIKFNFIQTNSVMYRWRFKNNVPKWFRYDIALRDWYWHLIHAEIGKIGFIKKIMSVYWRHAGALFYHAEGDRLKHRYLMRVNELQTFDVINKHFKGRFEQDLMLLASAVFAESSEYAVNKSLQETLDPLREAYPSFAAFFDAALQAANADHTAS